MSNPPPRGRTIATLALFGAFVLPAIAATESAAGSRVNLTLLQAAGPGSMEEGWPVSFTVQVVNKGARAATHVMTFSPLPPGVVYLSADPGCKFSEKRQSIVCKYGRIPPDGNAASKSFSLILPAAGLLQLTTTGESAEPDFDKSDNTVTTTASIVARPHDFAASPVIVAPVCAYWDWGGCMSNAPFQFTDSGWTYLEGNLESSSTFGVRDLVLGYGASFSLKLKFDYPPLQPMPPAHEVSLYLSKDNSLDAGDQLIWSSTTSALDKLSRKQRGVSIEHFEPGYQSSVLFLFLKLDGPDGVPETDETNNVVSIPHQDPLE